MQTCYYKNEDTLAMSETIDKPIIPNGSVLV